MKTSQAESDTMNLFLSDTPPASVVGPVAKARWRATIAALADEGRKLPKSNEGPLVAYCAAHQLLSDCDQSLATDGLLVDGGRDGKRRSPALTGKIQALAAIRTLAGELALTPSSAYRARLPQPTTDEPNEFQDA